MRNRARTSPSCAPRSIASGIAYRVNPRLVRGLDYYSRTVFEWITDALGAQDAVCSGGRYDGLIAQLGGRGDPGDRLCARHRAGRGAAGAGGQRAGARSAPDVYIIVSGDARRARPCSSPKRLRDALPRRGFELNLGGGNFKTQFRRADRSGAPLALICGDEELERGVVAVKPLRAESGQTECPQAELAGWRSSWCGSASRASG